MKQENIKKLEKFLENLYSDFDNEIEKIRTLEFNQDKIPQQRFFNSYQELIDFVNSNTRNKDNFKNYYLQLSTIKTEGVNGKTENLLNRSALVFDFDKKDFDEGFNHIDIVNRYAKNNIDYHCIIDSGNGYHVYTFIEKTNDIELVDKIQNKLCSLLNADINAIKKTQIMRIPFTFNAKDTSNLKHVNIMFMYDNIYKKDIGYYEKVFLNSEGAEEVAQNKLYNKTTVKPCINYLIENGIAEGNRHNCLLKIVTYFKQKGYSLEQVREITTQFNSKCKPTLSEYDLEYHTNYIYENVGFAKYECEKCTTFLKNKCIQFNGLNEFSFDNVQGKYELIKLNEKDMKKLEKRKTQEQMEKASVLIYHLLLHNECDMSITEIEKELTTEQKQALSKNTIKKALQNLLNIGLIELLEGVSDKGQKQKLYRATISDTKDKEMNYFISSGALYECIKGNISLNDYRVYNYMRYLKNKNDRENEIKRVVGNRFYVNQEKVAEGLGTNQATVSRAIQNLEKRKILSVYKYKSDRKSKKLYYNVYTFNY